MPKGKDRGTREAKKPKQEKKPGVLSKETFLRPAAPTGPAKPAPK